MANFIKWTEIAGINTNDLIKERQTGLFVRLTLFLMILSRIRM